jgi:hypothetical protein
LRKLTISFKTCPECPSSSFSVFLCLTSFCAGGWALGSNPASVAKETMTNRPRAMSGDSVGCHIDGRGIAQVSNVTQDIPTTKNDLHPGSTVPR